MPHAHMIATILMSSIAGHWPAHHGVAAIRRLSSAGYDSCNSMEEIRGVKECWSIFASGVASLRGICWVSKLGHYIVCVDSAQYLYFGVVSSELSYFNRVDFG